MRKLYLIIAALLCTIMMSSCVLYEKYLFSSKDIAISNPCEGETGLDFKIISLIGDRNTQTLTLTGKFINHDVNKVVKVGGELICYDAEGNAHNSNNSFTSFKSLTDVPVRFEMPIPGQMVPKRNKKMSVISFDIDECRIELRNVPIMWKTVEKK